MPYRRSIVASASEDRLEKLIRERLAPGSDKKAIDQRIWDLFGEQWCVMFTDLSGFSRNVAEFGIIHFLQTIYEAERMLVPIVEAHDGILLKVEGDSFLVIFRNVQKGLQAAVAMQRALAKYDADKSDAEKVLLCVGLGYGPMLRIGDLDVFGHEVNSASKLGEDAAKAWEILVTDAVCEQAAKVEGIGFEPLDEGTAGRIKAWRVVYGR
jgi:class 3 adenylate cyclase